MTPSTPTIFWLASRKGAAISDDPDRLTKPLVRRDPSDRPDGLHELSPLGFARFNPDGLSAPRIDHDHVGVVGCRRRHADGAGA